MYARLLAAFCIAAMLARSSSLDPEPARVVVYLQTEKPDLLLPPTMEALKHEVSKQLNLAGFEVDWWTPHASGATSNSSLVVAKLKGNCAPAAPVRASRTANAGGQKLGIARMDGKQIQPFVAVDCTLLSDFLGNSLTAARGEHHDLYGRALGRLMSHELYHVLARTTKHSRTGIAREEVSVRELLSNNFDFDFEASSLLQAAAALDVSFEDHRHAEE